MAFPITGGFCDACEAKCPVALVLLSYYLVFVRPLPDIWRIGRMADRGIQVLQDSGILGSRWSSALEISTKAMRMINREEIVTLMLG